MLPIELMRPMDAAAADSPSVSVGSTQNGGDQAHKHMPVTQSQNITAKNDRPGIADMANAQPAAMRGSAVCSLRSSRRSEDRAAGRTMKAARMKGNVESKVA